MFAGELVLVSAWLLIASGGSGWPLATATGALVLYHLAGWLTLVWLIWRRILKTKPAWLISFWGGNIEWKDVQRLMITFLAVAKLIRLVCVLLCIWLSLWAW